MKRWLPILGLLAMAGCTQQRRAQVSVPATGLPPMMQRQVLNAVDAGDGNPRVRALRAEVAAKASELKPRLELAAEYERTGYPELELEHLRLAADRFADSELAIRHLARALVRAGRAAEAAGKLQTFVTKQPKAAASVYSWAGIAMDDSGDLPGGERMHRKAIEKASWRDDLHNNLGYNLLMQARKSEAAEAFRRALTLNPASGTARNNLGLALADQPNEALAQFRRAAADDLGVAHNNMAAYLYDQGDKDGARKELELALQYRKDMPRILENLRKVAGADGRPIQMPSQQRDSFWRTFGRGLKHVFVEEDQKEKTKTGTAEAAR
ncbi:MAG: tetratricopeptide repeat protein [Acidobacteria bacterium]|nr:tetratricopeptide repeat protein [Acidobacteriota bacterium]